MTRSFHKTNFGRFGEMLPADTEGYVHLTLRGWIDSGYNRNQAREMLNRAKHETAKAEEALNNWRKGN